MTSVDDVTIVTLTREDLEGERLNQVALLAKEGLTDQKPCCCCLRQGFKETHKQYQKGLGKAGRESKLDCFACAIDKNGDLLGYCMLGFHDTAGDITMDDFTCIQEIPKQGTCHLEQIAVNEKARGKGVGKKLLMWADAKATQRGCHTMQLEVINSNKAAKAIYEKGGYVAKDSCCKQCCFCPLLCCLMRVPYVHNMVKALPGTE